MPSSRTYLPYLGDYYQYGYGPEHIFFSDAQVSAPSLVSNTSATEERTRNEYYDDNPYIDAYTRGRIEAADHGGRDTPQSLDPGRTTSSPLGTALTYGGNLLSMGLGPLTTLGGLGYSMSQGRNPSQLGLLSTLGLSPTTPPTVNRVTPQQMLNNPLGQSTGSASQDFFSAINDLATVGQLGEVLGARDTNRGPAQDFSSYADFSGGDPAAGANSPGTSSEFGADGGDMYSDGGPVPGPTDGQADKVPAYLSHGEYVFDAPTVAALGGGNNEAGARKLDAIREKIRQQAYGSKKQPKPVDAHQLMKSYAGIRG